MVVLFFLACATTTLSQETRTIDFEVPFEHWEGCETGEGECETLQVLRSSLNDQVNFVMPCGGTQTDVYLTNTEGILQELHIIADECPPVFDLTDLPDGEYSASMAACGLGGSVQFTLKTE